ncbi:hypothetical protein [Kribbella orskensis]|uniref:hypothetical protein n=1 Tax=Kribbella orskensis TaxID=2512216 RepID=UPI0010535578|nr:hypothetical protein [Kribbella orskensis]
MLARTVAVELFAPDSPRRCQVAAAVRAASRAVDPRLVQIYDANDRFDPPYAVSEWVTGTPLPEMLATGPLDELTVVDAIGEVAAAIAAAHREGVAHLRLVPRMVIRGGAGMVKVRGVAIRAALAGVTARDLTLVDARGLGTLLYAGLTGLWPGGEVDGLPQAPVRRWRLCTPRQVRPELDPELDGIASRALRCVAVGSQVGTADGRCGRQRLLHTRCRPCGGRVPDRGGPCRCTASAPCRLMRTRLPE